MVNECSSSSFAVDFSHLVSFRCLFVYFLSGPSALGQIPGFSKTIFPPESLGALSLFASIGLIFFMFFLGLEVEPKSIIAALRSSILIAVSSILVPFICGSLLSIWLYNIEDTDASFTVFLLFLGTALSFTAFPVLARVLTTSDLLFSPVGVQALSCAAVDDLLAWCTLACTLSYANGGGIAAGLYIAFIATGFILFLVFPVRMLFTKIHNRLRAKGKEFDRNFLAIILLGLCISSWFAEILGIHAFFGVTENKIWDRGDRMGQANRKINRVESAALKTTSFKPRVHARAFIHYRLSLSLSLLICLSFLFSIGHSFSLFLSLSLSLSLSIYLSLSLSLSVCLSVCVSVLGVRVRHYHS